MAFKKIGEIAQCIKHGAEQKMIGFEKNPVYKDGVLQIFRSVSAPMTCFMVKHIPSGYSAIVTADHRRTAVVEITCYDPHDYVVGERDAHYTGVVANAFLSVVGQLP